MVISVHFMIFMTVEMCIAQNIHSVNTCNFLDNLLI
jgi:hypothetical protein